MTSKLSGPIPTHEIYEEQNVTSKPYSSLERTKLGGSLGKLDVLQWQSNTSSVHSSQLYLSIGRPSKNYIRDNIRRLRQYQKVAKSTPHSNRKDILAECGVPMQLAPLRPFTAGSKCIGYSKASNNHRVCSNTKDSGFGDQNTVIPNKPNENEAYMACPCPEYSVDSDEPSGCIPGYCSPASVQTTKQHSPTMFLSRSTQYSTPEKLITISQGVQAGIFDGDNTAEHAVRQSSESFSPRARSLVRKRTRATSADSKKHDFMRAHAKTASDDWNLYVLGSTPVRRVNWTPRPEQLTVPKASTAKSVQMIRRDINFVRANAHLAAAGGRRASLKSNRASGLRDVSPDMKSMMSPRRSSVLTTAMDGRLNMWPQRRLPVGGIPPYLIKRRQKAAETAALEAANRPDPEQPPGHQRMPEEERLTTLHLLKKAHKELSDEWSRLPVRMDTVRICTRRAELEQRLTDLEQAISIFEKPKVFIKPE
ncbi:hypothetical protein EG68_06945 [Paragonimus skrjabini miyazakii]|uniref:Enkurin domain-containing protein n=1 Tax=Paragonimus skrjabini miyazakii TaxID=59628 RepID=A0A8S9YZG3_9TREM|nr:hypothetical protein EG68_06945 [Paragonimus skrjabini miyazakii]